MNIWLQFICCALYIQEIETDDIHFAAKLSEQLCRLDQKTRTLEHLARDINSRPLHELIPDERNKRKHPGNLTVRAHTFIPGHIAYTIKVQDI